MDKKFLSLIKELLELNKVLQASFSHPLSSCKLQKASFRPLVLPKKGAVYQLTFIKKNQAFQHNLSQEELYKWIYSHIDFFRQVIFFTQDKNYHWLKEEGGKTSFRVTPGTKKPSLQSHNVTKTKILQEGIPIDFLIHTDIMSKEGKILSRKRDKFAQINSFLEIVQSLLPFLIKEKKSLSMVDFGCGKAYLTFALYYFLEKMHHIPTTIVGVDVKEDLLAKMQQTAKELHFHGISFVTSTIENYDLQKVDLVVALHACNTATDQALFKATRSQARAILAVPCCQQELFPQLHSSSLPSLIEHGVIKEELGSLITDAARADLLQMQGYNVHIMEFTSPEHTSKNILIKALYGNKKEERKKAQERYVQLKKFFSITPCLEKLLYKNSPLIS